MKIYIYSVITTIFGSLTFGLLLPHLFSEESDIAVFLGIITTVISPIIFAHLFNKILKEIKKHEKK